jgi:uncharacterized membrane protein YhhN
MFAKENQPFWTSLSARMAVAVAIEVAVVLAMVLHNSELWLGRTSQSTNNPHLSGLSWSR